MSSDPRQPATELVWPPPEEDLAAIEVLELHHPADPTPPAAPAANPVTTVAAAETLVAPPQPPPSHPPRQGVVEVVELDAMAGPETYVLDIRSAPADEAPRRVTTFVEDAPLPPSSAPAPFNAPAAIAPPADEGLEWPPREADLDAITVVEIPAAAPAAGDDVRPDRAPPAGVAGPRASLSEAPPGEEPVAQGTDLALEWPPRESDLDAIEVVELAPATAVAAFDGEPSPSAGASTVPSGLAAEAVRGTDDAASSTREPALFGVQAGTDAAALPRGGSVLKWVAAGLLTTTIAGLAGWYGATRWRAGDQPTATDSPASRPQPGAGAAAAGRSATGAAATEAPAAGEASGTSAAADTAMDTATAALARGDRLGAIDALVAHQQAGGRDARVVELADRMLTTLLGDVERVRLEATARLAGRGDAAEVAAVERRQATAQAQWRAGQYDRAMRGLLEARQAYARLRPGGAGVAASPAPTPAAAAPTATGAPPGPPAPVSPADTTGPGRAPLGPPAPPLAAAAPAVSAPVPPATGTPAPARPEPARAEAATSGAAAVDAGVRRALRAYQSAYETLDAQAAAAVYPRVDARALGRAFDGLSSQKLDFERCDVTPVSADQAQATCVGRAAFVPRVGSQTPRVEQRRWSFVLQRQGEVWRIVGAQVGPR